MAQANLKAVITAEDRASSTIAGVSGGFLKMASAMGVGQLAANAVSSAVDLLTKNMSGAISRVDTLNNFPKVMQNLGYSTAEAAVELGRLEKGVMGLPTSLSDIASAMQNIAPSSKSLSQATDIALALNNALIAGGQSADLQSTAMQQFSQAISKGKPDMVEWRALATAMPGQLDQITQSLGYGRGQWQKMATDVSEGKLEFSKVTDAIIKLNNDGLGEMPGFAEQAKNASNGIGTSIANMNTAITRGIANIIQTIGSENISKALTGLGDGFEQALKWIKAVAIEMYDRLKPAFEFLKQPLADLWNQIQTHLLPALQEFWVAIQPLLPILGTVLIGAIYGLIIGMRIWVYYLTLLVQWYTTLANFITNFPATIQNMATVVVGWFNWLSNNWTMVIGYMIGFVASLPGKILFYLVQMNIMAWNYLRTVDWGQVATWFVDHWKSVPGRIYSVMESLRHRIMNMDWGAMAGAVARGFVNGINGMIEGAINGALSGVPGAPRIKLPRFAGGVQNFGGGLAVVGERGPELVHLPKGSDVIPNHQIGNTGGGAGSTVNVTVQAGAFMGSQQDARKYALQIAEALKDVANMRNTSAMELLS